MPVGIAGPNGDHGDLRIHRLEEPGRGRLRPVVWDLEDVCAYVRIPAQVFKGGALEITREENGPFARRHPEDHRPVVQVVAGRPGRWPENFEPDVIDHERRI